MRRLYEPNFVHHMYRMPSGPIGSYYPYYQPFPAQQHGYGNQYYPHPYQNPYMHMNGFGVSGFPQQQQNTAYGISNEPPIFDNPLQMNQNQPKAPQAVGQGYMNPYPKEAMPPKPYQNNTGSFLNSFKSQDGSIDFNKMMNTAGQMMNAVNQVSSMVKGLGGLFK
ncbi:YppG family protein [Heyndrickxia ginsengihumi]|uniref:Spore coat protein n=1 Tax=Heyndrickxia ginsengihumi TaxID=363870 RepID=A0A0A6VDT3_9BACI|nr:YppG family protein [Heyndrickxia ginsengihumi]KHD85648.1 hypothetical protein NG54_07685 [Heyndrickxia ginsengihumi]NEY20549.1 hypothetical protein [Heyndrickxia ginsengihumi]